MKSTRDFREIYRIGRKYPGRFFVLFVTPREDQLVRFGVTASRRVGNAVVRNRAKRIMREAVRHVFPVMQCGADIVLVARAGIRETGTSGVLHQLSEQLRKARLTSETVSGGSA
ncbi:MAG TPA: ribonuclease P protein component [bacterium]|nr:ribonuclease P protein component [bacterium]